MATRYKVILWSTPKNAGNITRETIRTTCWVWHVDGEWRWWSCSKFHARHGISGEPIHGRTIEETEWTHSTAVEELSTPLPNGENVVSDCPPWWQLWKR